MIFRLAALLRRARNRRGIATVEFALVAPVMFIIMLGTIELGNVFRIQAKVNNATGELALLIATETTVTAPSGTLADRCVGAALNLTPFPRGALSADIVSITNDHPINRVNGSTDSTSVQTYLDWENISACPTQSGTTMTLTGAYGLANAPLSLLTKSGASAQSAADLAYSYSVIVVSTSYSYQNFLSFILGRTIKLTSTAVARPRTNVTITCTNVAGSTACPALQ